MLLFIARRVLGGLFLLAVISVLAYTLLFLGSQNVARRILGESATAETVAAKSAELGLDRPLVIQYLDWLRNALTGNLGRSWYTSEPVATAVTSRLGVTLSIVITTVIVAAIISVVIGIVAAQRGGAVDATLQFFAVLGLAVPNFLIALGLVLLFAISLRWFPATGYTPITESVGEWIASITLPVVALSCAVVAATAQQIRGSVLDAMSRDYVRTLRSRGLGTRSVVYTHVLRNAAGPALAVIAVQFVGLLGGAVVVEQVFALPGIGQLAVQATTIGDIPVVMAITVVTAIIVVIVNLVIDLAQAALNPKVRLR